MSLQSEALVNGEPHSRREVVIVAHGIGAVSWTMLPLVYRLRNAGFRVINWGYQSALRSIDDHVRRLVRELRELEDQADVDVIHLVGHSMGSIICRAAITHHSDWRKLGRLVMLTPPNRGSVVARHLGPWLSWLSPAVPQLSDEPESYVNQLGVPGVETAVFAASLDHVVPLASTHLPDERLFRVFPGLHSTIPWRQDVSCQVVSFLRDGHPQVVEPPSALPDAMSQTAAATPDNLTE